LRAVAVLPVVGYHAGIAPLSGGFVGVDVFFVISGYLIGSIIVAECREGRFSLVKFYERRVRRIIPALLVVLAATLALAYRYSLPAEFEQIGWSAAAAVLFASNLYFWQHSDYFDAPAEAQPLLHTWSLAIEEQFYLFVPLLVMAAFRWFPRWLAPIVVAIAALSLAGSELQVSRDRASAFYLIHARAWELMLGLIVALGLFPRFASSLARNAATALGFAMIVYAVFAYSSDMRFPGRAALLPCLGAALIIAAGRSGGSVVASLLSLRPVVFVGLISYSLYLWHWPLMVFQRSDAFLVSGATRPVEQAVVVGASFLAAILSWRFVERPFRAADAFPRPALFRLAFVGSGAVAGAALAAVALQGLPSRYPPEARRIAAFLAYDPAAQYRVGRCMIPSGYRFADFDRDLCLGFSATERDYLLLGDSHAAHLWHGLDRALPGVNVMQATASGCRPVLGRQPGDSAWCRDLMDYVLEDFLVAHRVDALLLAARWSPEHLPALRQTLDWASDRGVDVILFGPVVQYDAAVPRLLANARRFEGAPSLDARRLDELAALDRRMASMVRAEGHRYVSLWRAMCGEPSCLADAGAEPLQFDYGHFTARGSETLARLLVRQGLLP